MDPKELLEKAREAMRRDINHIFVEVAGKKLAPASARDLVAYVKLLSEVVEEESEDTKDLEKLPDSELKELAKKLIDDKTNKSS